MKRFLIVLFGFLFLLNSMLSNTCFASPAGEIRAKGVEILKVLMWFGYAIAFGMLVFIGIKYMLGAADAKASMKSAITGWLIGAVIVFATSTIVGIVVTTVSTGNGISGDSIIKALDD